MQYGLVYFATNAGPNKDRVNIYFMSDLSTPDREGGSIAPRIDPFNLQKLSNFIASDFLDAVGNVKAVFNSLAAVSASVK